MNFSAVVLAGGKSTSMGQDQAFLKINGRILLARQIERLREVGATEVLIAGRTGRDYSAFDCRVLWDKYSDAGPMAGIERALAARTMPLLLVPAVDLPDITWRCSVAWLRKTPKTWVSFHDARGELSRWRRSSQSRLELWRSRMSGETACQRASAIRSMRRTIRVGKGSGRLCLKSGSPGLAA